MADIFGTFGGFGSVATIGKYLIWFFVFLIIAGCLTAMVIMVLIKKNQKKIIEINMMNKRLRIFNGRKKKKRGIESFWIGRIRKYLPDFQQESIYIKGKQDTVILLKDNNGLYHTARIPTYSDLRKWYQVIHGVDLTTAEQDKLKNLEGVYLLPAPHEDLDWLAGQCAEAEKEFKIDHWWQSPTVAYIGVGFVCFLMIVVTLILEKKL